MEGSAGRESGRKRAECMASFLCFCGPQQYTGKLVSQYAGTAGPIVCLCGKPGDGGLQTESGSTYERILLLEGASEYTESEDGDALEVPETSEGRIQLDDKMTQLLQEENQTGRPEEEESAEQEETPVPSADQFGFIRAGRKKPGIQLELLSGF